MPEDHAEAIQSYQKGADLGMTLKLFFYNIAIYSYRPICKCLDPVSVDGSLTWPDDYFCLCGCVNIFSFHQTK